MRYILILLFALVTNNSFAAGNTGSAIAPAEYVCSIQLKGDLGFISKSYRSLKKGAGAASIHTLCYDKCNGARGAEYSDFQHIISDLEENKYWIVDPYVSKRWLDGGAYSDDYALLRKDGTTYVADTASDGSCDDFTSTSSSLNATVLNTSNNSLEMNACNLDAYIACVKN